MSGDTVHLSAHAAHRWDNRTPADSVSPEQAWADARPSDRLTGYTHADEARFHRPTETVLVRRGPTIVTVLLSYADPVLAEIVDELESRTSGGASA